MEVGKPLVSICCITYNHEEFLRECLDGFMMQRTNFDFEVLIHDDASTDSTADIIREYEAKYPNIIKPIYQKENQYSKGKGILVPFVYPKAKGKYIALCEGDDYWTDPYKLQKQVDFLEEHPDFSMCFHNALETWENGSRGETLFARIKDKDYSGIEIYKEWVIPTASVVFRKIIIDTDFYKDVSVNPNFIFGDIVLFLTCAEYGKIKGLSEVMSVYRRHEGGVVFRPSLSRDYKQSLQDLELGRVYRGKISEMSRVFCFKRSLSNFFYAKKAKKRKLAIKNKKLFLKVFRFRYIIYIPRVIASFIKHKNKYSNE